jgi:catechol 2,3-dioxygenase-like lactoylglutathione lyase family enzyme
MWVLPAPTRTSYGRLVLDHLALQVRDVDAAASFYARAFSALRVHEAMRLDRPEGAVVGLSGADQFPHLWLGPLVDPGVRPVHLALTAPSREAVDAVYAAAQEIGAERSCILRGCGPSTTRATTPSSCATRTGTTSKGCITRSPTSCGRTQSPADGKLKYLGLRQSM